MPIEKWSDRVVVVHLADDPQLTDDFDALDQAIEPADVVLDFGAVRYMNSSNISKLLNLRRKMLLAERKLVLCNVTTQVWGILLVPGLDKIFQFSDNVPTALATVQMAQ